VRRCYEAAHEHENDEAETNLGYTDHGTQGVIPGSCPRFGDGGTNATRPLFLHEAGWRAAGLDAAAQLFARRAVGLRCERTTA
jgi:hypothetical protein